MCATVASGSTRARGRGCRMPDPSQWLVFVVASLALLVTPGPAVLYVVTCSLDGGRRVGLASVAGIGIGTLAHVAAATLGLSAVLASSALAFGVVKWAGAGYLVYVGVRRMLGADGEGTRRGMRHPPARHAPAIAFRQGILVNLLNPKTALFFLAFLPQFVNPAHRTAPQLLALGLAFTAFGVTSDASYALLAGTMRRAWPHGPGSGWLRVQRILVGGVFVALGVTAVFARRPA
jgi:threonine/homoserine/homoserine lactone efflux protein